jgi:hypothetical protein
MLVVSKNDWAGADFFGEQLWHSIASTSMAGTANRNGKERVMVCWKWFFCVTFEMAKMLQGVQNLMQRTCRLISNGKYTLEDL